MLPCACTCSASHAVVKEHSSDLRACFWEQNKLFLGFGLLQFTFVVKIRRGGEKMHMPTETRRSIFSAQDGDFICIYKYWCFSSERDVS